MDLLLHLFCQGYLCGQSPAGGCASLGFLSSLEADGEALAHMQEGPCGCPLTLLLHNQAIEWLSPVLWGGNRACPMLGSSGAGAEFLSCRGLAPHIVWLRTV